VESRVDVKARGPMTKANFKTVAPYARRVLFAN
jgi:hypothetical protein